MTLQHLLWDQLSTTLRIFEFSKLIRETTNTGDICCCWVLLHCNKQLHRPAATLRDILLASSFLQWPSVLIKILEWSHHWIISGQKHRQDPILGSAVLIWDSWVLKAVGVQHGHQRTHCIIRIQYEDASSFWGWSGCRCHWVTTAGDGVVQPAPSNSYVWPICLTVLKFNQCLQRHSGFLKWLLIWARLKVSFHSKTPQTLALASYDYHFSLYLVFFRTVLFIHTIRPLCCFAKKREYIILLQRHR